MSGLSTGTLNHIAGPHPVKEWVDCVLEEDRLMDKLRKLSGERTTHELVLRMAGVPRETLEEALTLARTLGHP